MVLLVYSLSILRMHSSYAQVTSELSFCIGSDHHVRRLTRYGWHDLVPQSLYVPTVPPGVLSANNSRMVFMQPTTPGTHRALPFPGTMY